MGNNKTVKERVEHQSKSILGKILFTPLLFTILCLLLQIMIIFAAVLWLNQYTDLYFGVFTVITFFILVYITNSEYKPDYKIAWMIPICIAPVFGIILYIVLQTNIGSYGLKKAVEIQIDKTKPYLKQKANVTDDIKNNYVDIKGVSNYLNNIGNFPSYDDTKVTYFPIGEDNFASIIEQLNKATKFIFLEYFIIEEGVFWNSVLEVLKKKLDEGVEVRIMYDGTCAVTTLPFNYAKKLRKIGFKAKAYAPINPVFSTHQNNRDHRKILVIDGKVGYTGGVNLADEYINEYEKYGHWKDVAIMLEGTAVKSLTAMFLQMWGISEKVDDNLDTYLLDPYIDVPEIFNDINIDKSVNNPYGIVIPYGDDATNDEDIAEDIYCDILDTARHYVHIMTPYFIVDDEILSTITYAAKRGVDVKILLPHIEDKKIAYNIARTYYPVLLKAGVKVYEYTPGFVHAKVFVSDDIEAVVGTINLDYRSLYHHFECGVYTYKNSVVEAIEEDFNKTLKVSQEVTMEYYKSIPLYRRFIGRVARIIAPLL